MKITQPQKKALQLIDGGYVKHCHPFTFTAAHSAPSEVIGWICDGRNFRTLDSVLRHKLARVITIGQIFRDVELTEAGRAALANR